MPHVIACSGDDDEADWPAEIERDVSWYEMWIAEVDGRPIGVMQIIDPAEEESHYWGEVEPNLRAIDIWIGEPDMLGQGYGTTMMSMALAGCFADDTVRAVIIDPLQSNTRAIAFYASLGFKVVGPRRFGDDDCLVMRLDQSDFWHAAAPWLPTPARHQPAMAG